MASALATMIHVAVMPYTGFSLCGIKGALPVVAAEHLDGRPVCPDCETGMTQDRAVVSRAPNKGTATMPDIVRENPPEPFVPRPRTQYERLLENVKHANAPGEWFRINEFANAATARSVEITLDGQRASIEEWLGVLLEFRSVRTGDRTSALYARVVADVEEQDLPPDGDDS